MKRRLSAIALAACIGAPLGASAQSPPPPPAIPGALRPSPSPELRAQLEQLRTEAKAAAFKALTPAHQASVQAIIDQTASGAIADPRAAVTQLDALLTPAETSALLAIRTKMIADRRALMSPAGLGAGSASPAPSERADEGGRRPPDAGRFLLMVSLTPDQARSIMSRQPAAPRSPSP